MFKWCLLHIAHQKRTHPVVFVALQNCRCLWSDRHVNQSQCMYIVSRRQRYMSFSVYLLRCIIRTVTLIKRLKTTFKILKSHHPHCHNYIFCSFFSSRQINEWWSFPQSLHFGAGHCLMSCFTFFRDFKPKPYFFTLSRLSFLDILFLNCRQLEAAP